MYLKRLISAAFMSCERFHDLWLMGVSAPTSHRVCRLSDAHVPKFEFTCLSGFDALVEVLRLLYLDLYV